MRWRVLISDRLAPPADVEQSIFGDDVEIILGEPRCVGDIPSEIWESCDNETVLKQSLKFFLIGEDFLWN